MPPVDVRRWQALDQLRGFAITLMVMDHALVLIDPDSPARYSITRAALPLFCIASAQARSSRPPRWSRIAALVCVGAAISAASALWWPELLVRPDVLIVFAAAIAIRYALRGLHPVVVAIIGWTQAAFLPIGWDGYELGTLVMWLAIGALVSAPTIDELASKLPKWLAVLGRYPLTVYAGHLGCLFVLEALL